MSAPSTIDELLQLVRKSGLVEEKRLEAYLQRLHSGGPLPPEPAKLAGLLVQDAILTQFQAEQLLLGKWRRFYIGKYKVLERIGSGGMGSVYLCEHTLMRRRVAIKVLPTNKADDSSARERFLREARAVAALDHPNIVRAYDIDQDDNLHFLVMEYVDGSNLQEIIKRTGPMDLQRAAHYFTQAALALQHAHEVAGIVHRDIKPGNILVDRNGVVKVLDMGLARFFHDEEDLLTQKYDENVLGTADYLAPEQALDSHSVDIRADIYSLGATLYFCLVGKAPFNEGTVAQKLIWHQTRQPRPVHAQRPEVPEAMSAVVEKMMAKDPDQRFQIPLEIAEALASWTQTPIPPPSEAEMPRLSPAAQGSSGADPSPAASSTPAGSGSSVKVRKVWQSPGSPRPLPGGTAPLVSPPSAKPAVKRPEPPPPQGRAATAGATRPAAPAEDPEPIRWEALTADTLDAVGQADTVPHHARPRRPATTVVPGSATRIDFPFYKDHRVWIAGGILLALGLLVGLWRLATKERPKNPPPAAAGGPRVLRVQRAAHGQQHAYATLREALAKARNQDRIQVFDPVIEEQLSLSDSRLARDVIVESGLEGKPVLWRAPAHLKEGEPLLKINSVEGVHFRGFHLDGQERVKDLITLSGPCPGVNLEELQLSGFTGRAIVFVNCEGRSDKPVRMTRVRISRDLPRQVGLFFDALPKVREGVNQHILVSTCRVEGGGEQGGVVVTSLKVLHAVKFVDSPRPEETRPPNPPSKN